MKRRFYLNKKDLEESISVYFKELKDYFSKDELEYINTREGMNRITALPIFANENVPSYNSSAMDGIAVVSKKTYGTNESNPIILEKEKDFKYINTGYPINNPYDSVIMIENIEIIDDEHVQIRNSVYPYKDVRKVGEDICKGEMLFPRYHTLTAADISFLMMAKVFEIPVIKKMKILLIPTGNEIVKPEELTEGFQIPETNSLMIKNYLEQLNAIVDVNEILSDDLEIIKSTIFEKIKEYDLILLNAGSSAGSKDFTYHAINDLGKVIIHGINIKPGKPAVLGIVNEKPVIGLPGFPVSCNIIMEDIVKPLLLNKTKYEIYYDNEKIEGISAKRIHSSITEKEYLRVGVGKVENNYIAIPLKRGAANISSISNQDGIVFIDKGVEVVEDGDELFIHLRRSKSIIDNNILITGSHDLLLDLLADFIKKYDKDINIVSANVGSLGGILSIAKGYAHMAGMHLLDPETGEYNISYIKEYMDNFKLMNLSYREQGFIIQKGNPKNIKDFEDLTKDGVRYINRQKTAGTRILLDYYLDKKDISPKKIHGYSDEEYSHVNLALKIKKDMADVGLGIKAAANIYDLDFVPIALERYDLLIHESFINDKRFELIMNIITSKEFKEEAYNLGGYILKDTGKIWEVVL
ncbi:molybdopterin biosynthesis protein [Marinitoga sp. 38H-ov]|uniref:molybdopterin biosynthesis protein n=1 Tax=Marinitoga sp. 38H-ov TaxID=1755814 RepID=UPI0013EA9237|nr:molybdopterin biosynthesis protein [Marinitoga sp. 38H-ov]KAF2956939.1 molybdenum cofactor biosynthesis protein [Marinitoga sp. 38H-ov]